MVGEFPELQGLMGGYYAAAQGEHPAVAAAIRDHYKPVGQGDDVPTDPVTVAVSLADKLDTLVSFFAAQEFPTGSKDPFALRRAMLGVVSIIQSGGLRFNWIKAFTEAADEIYAPLIRSKLSHLGDHVAFGFSLYRYPNRPDQDDYGYTQEAISEFFDVARGIDIAVENAPNQLGAFLIDRLKVQQREAGVRHDLIDAVFALGGEDDLVRLLARVHALQAFVTTEDGANLLAGYKRAANILKKEAPSAPSPPKGEGRGEGRGEGLPSSAAPGTAPHPDPLPGGEREKMLSDTPEPAEAALMTALDSAEPRATTAIAREDFAAAMAALASLRAPIDAFFDSVIVNDADPAKRSARLALLERVRAAVHNVADFSKIEG
jgi:glycyl-tRNA synthetase beta chain